MNGVDLILDREYQQQLAEEAVEKERARLDKLPKSLVGGLDGFEYKYVRPTVKHDLPNKWPVNQSELVKQNPFDRLGIMSVATYQNIPMDVLYPKEYVEQRLNNQKKSALGMSDFDRDGVKMSFR